MWIQVPALTFPDCVEAHAPEPIVLRFLKPFFPLAPDGGAGKWVCPSRMYSEPSAGLGGGQGARPTEGSSFFPFFELLQGWVKENLLPSHVVMSWHPQSGSCLQTCISLLRRLPNRRFQSFIHKDVKWNSNYNAQILEIIWMSIMRKWLSHYGSCTW